MILHVVGLYFVQSGTYEQALPLIEKSLQLGNDNPYLLPDLAFVYMNVGTFDNLSQL